MAFTAADLARYWSKVAKSPHPGGCWLWRDSCSNVGYGNVNLGGRWRTAHRVSFEIAFGPIPAGKLVCHRCDVRNCVRPDHLFLGTQQENIQAAARKGRACRGELNGRSKLTTADIKRIRSLAASGHVHSEVASQFGVARAHISRIVARRSWAHI